VAWAAFYLILPTGSEPTTSATAAVRDSPTQSEIEASATLLGPCMDFGDGGTVEFSLEPGRGARVGLPKNRTGIEDVIVALDEQGDTVWMIYAGELTGKGRDGRPPIGIVEQLVSGDPTSLVITISPGPPPLNFRLMIEQDEERTAAAVKLGESESWAVRGRK
jgi:hypothetical protein